MMSQSLKSATDFRADRTAKSVNWRRASASDSPAKMIPTPPTTTLYLITDGMPFVSLVITVRLAAVGVHRGLSERPANGSMTTGLRSFASIARAHTIKRSVRLPLDRLTHDPARRKTRVRFQGKLRRQADDRTWQIPTNFPQVRLLIACLTKMLRVPFYLRFSSEFR